MQIDKVWKLYGHECEKKINTERNLIFQNTPGKELESV